MAEHLGKDAKTYAEEYTAFSRELRAFHDIRGTSYSRLPRLHGHEIDLYLLYSLVTTRGGWEKVNINGDWESLLPYFGINRLCANGPIGLKQIYVRYLDVYERVHFLGEEVDRRESELHEEDDARNRRKALRLLHATPTSYNAAQHHVTEHARSTAGLSSDVVQVTATERIFLSLLCPLPNEQDFAINVCSLLAMESRKPFPLHHCPRIVDALLAHAGIFSQVDLRDLFTESYSKFRGHNLDRFWQDVVPDADIVQLSEEDLLASQEDVNAASDTYWTRLPSSSKRLGQLLTTGTTELDEPEETTLDYETEHFFTRPSLVSKRPLGPDIDLDATEEEEEESQCSVGLYENGEIGPPSASASQSQEPVVAPTESVERTKSPTSDSPSFSNCLSKPSVLLDGQLEPARFHHQAVEPNGELTEDIAMDTDTKDEGNTNQSNLLTAVTTTATTDAAEGTAPTVEKKMVHPKNRLPIAVLKPDNPRAVRYWLDQRRTARSFPAQQAQQPSSPGGERKFLEDYLRTQKLDSEDWELFHLGRDLGVHDSLGQRILQVLNVIRNLSFDEVNSSLLAQSEACMRLLLLAAHSKWSCLPQLAFDALSNLASDVNLKDPAHCTLSAVLLGTVTRGLESGDRFVVLRCMEAIGRLAQRGEHESLLLSALDARMFERLCSYLTIPDVALLIYTLECVYALSSLGQSACNAFLQCHGAIDILISLLTIEAQSYGSKARILMNVVETVAEGDTATTHVNLTPVHAAPHAASHASRPSTVSYTASNSAPSAPSTPPPAVVQITTVPAVPPASALVASTTKILPKPNVPPRPTTPNVVSTISHTEKEQIAMQWLRATFEPIVGAPSIEQNALYRQYTAGCARNGPAKQVLGLVQFFSCVRATFGQNVGPFRKQVGSGVEFYFEGMSPKVSQPTPSISATTPASGTTSVSPSTVEVPGSPILKAQLCAPPKVNNRKESPKPSLAHPHLSQALGQSGSSETSPLVPTAAAGNASAAGGSGPPSSSLIKSLLANKVPEGGNSIPNTVVVAPTTSTLGLSPTATALPGMNRVSCMTTHVNTVPLAPSTTSTTTVTTVIPVIPSGTCSQQQVAQRQQQQKLIQQQQLANGPTKLVPTPVKNASSPAPKVNGFGPEQIPGGNSDTVGGSKGMLADLLEREVKKEPGVNGAAPLVTSKELRISDNGLELIPKDARGRFAVDMGVVGMNDLTGVDLGDGAAAPKAAHLIAQVDDSGHVQIHLEEETDGAALCNGQSLLDQLEACEVSSSTDPAPAAGKGVKRPAELAEENNSSPNKKAMTVNHHTGENAPKDERAPTEHIVSEKCVNGVVANGVAMLDTNTIAVTSGASTQPPPPPPVILGSNAPRTFLILQPQAQQQVNLAGFHPQGQRLLLAIQRPGGVVQHVAMPANVVAISSSQLQTNGGVVTLTTTGGIATAVVTTQAPMGFTTGVPTSTPITTMAASSNAVATTASVEGMVTFSGGAVAFPARPTESISRTSSPGESHVTITPVSAIPSSATVTAVSSVVSASPVASPVVVASAAAAAVKKRTNSVDSPKPRGRPAKNKSVDAPLPPPASPGQPGAQPTQPTSASPSPSPQPPFNPTHQYLCEWKECFKAFKTPHEVYVHACHVHCPINIDELGCLWERCDGLKRKRFSMMTHLMDRHCNDEVQKLLAARRLQMSTQGKTDIPAPQAPTPHPGYAPHAALHAIKRHAVELMNQKEQEEKEGPVTKSIRLTSALILRNFAMHSSLGRRILQRYEGHLASVALSNVESSRTVAQILYELTHQCS